jgi:hypothetical protein
MLGAAAALSRLVGVVLAPVLLAEWWRQRRAGEPRPPLVAALAACAVPLGTVAYMVYLWLRFGDALGFVTAAAAWGRAPGSPLTMLVELTRAPAEGWAAALSAGRVPLGPWVDLASLLLFLALGAVLLAERRWPEGLLVLLGALIPLSSGLLMSQVRYMWVLFPGFVLLARWGARPAVDRLITTISLALLVLFAALFANGYWVA